MGTRGFGEECSVNRLSLISSLSPAAPARLLAILACLLSSPPAAPAQDQPVFIKAGWFFDGLHPSAEPNVDILIEGKTIAAVGRNLTPPESAKVIDLSGMTVTPGLIDAHTHIVLHGGDYDGQVLRETPEYRAICATVSARKTLEGGVTTIRDLGNEGAGFADIALRDAIARGIVMGPRILAAIQPVTSTGSYDLVGYSPYITTPHLSYAADGPSEIRTQVRRLVKQGADVIKIYMESYEKKQSSDDSLTGALNYSPEEVKVIVEEANRAGLKVAAHTYSDAAARIAIEAGVNSIEHGLYLTEETFRLMAKRGVFYVPTLLVYEFWRDGKIFAPVSTETRRKLAYTVERHTETFRRALRSGVKIVFGTDTFELPGTNAREIELMVRYGMTPADALIAATSRAAELLGIAATTGTIERHKSADIVAFRGDLLAELHAIEHPVFVMKEGAIILREQ